MMEGQALNSTMNAFQAKPHMEFNSQGALVEKQAPVEEQAQQESLTDDVVPLWDTPLSSGMHDLMPATDDTNLEHKIISWGHVLKSTHDLARWSEKTGALRVNTQEAFDSVSDISVSLEAPARRNIPTNANNGNGGRNNNNSNSNNNRRRGTRRNANEQQWRQKSEVISCGPVLKSTHDRATWSEKRTVNGPESFQVLDEAAQNQGALRGKQGKSEIISCGPVLKSTHDLASRAEKRSVNGPESFQVLDEAAQNQANSGKSEIISCGPVLKSTHDLASRAEKRSVNDSSSAQVLDECAEGAKQAVQAGGSLQSGLDTQAGSHMQLDSTEKVKETPEQAIKSLNVHV